MKADCGTQSLGFLLLIIPVRKSPTGLAFGIVCPRKRSDPKGRPVWDFTYNHEAAGSNVWLKPGFSSSSAQPSRPQTPSRSPIWDQKKSARPGTINRKTGARWFELFEAHEQLISVKCCPLCLHRGDAVDEDSQDVLCLCDYIVLAGLCETVK